MKTSHFMCTFGVFSTVLALQLVGVSAQGFPDLIRHGYVNCNNCHSSPSGGGTINDYGRNFASEGISTWSRKGEESVLHGLIRRKSIPSWLSIGGDIRAVQFWEENKQIQSARSIMMQADFEAAVKDRGVTMDVAFGRFQTAAEEPRPNSRRYFLGYNFTDEIMLRAGRFTPVYGVNTADHIIATRRPLRLDQGHETFNIEASWITDTWNVFVTAIQGPVDDPTTTQEKGGSAQIAYAFHDTYKIGASYWSSSSEQATRQMAGVHTLLGFTPELYLMNEFDLQWTTPTGGTKTQGYFNYNRFGYEVYRGVHLLGTVELWQTDMNNPKTGNDRYGVGTQLFPRPHFDIQALWTKYRKLAVDDQYFQDYAWLVFHYYF